MKIAYIDCLSGISGDMVLGALLDLGVPLELLNDSIGSILPTVRIEPTTVDRKGFRAILANVLVPHEHEHRSLSTITGLIEGSILSDENKDRACALFRLLAEAEATVHGTDIDQVHFHEVGAADSIAEMVGCVVGFDYLRLDKIFCSPVPTGTGTVEIAHGSCSIPAPATAELLRGIPIAASAVPFELTTPTGAALLKFYVNQFGPMPGMTVKSIGVGAGQRDLQEQPNILRILLGDMDQTHKQLRSAAEYHSHAPVYEYVVDHIHDHIHEHVHHPHEVQTSGSDDSFVTADSEEVWLLETNIDDMTGELVGHCIDRLWKHQPLDVWTTPIQMKKQRPGIILSVLCRVEQLETLESILFVETTTLGIRRRRVERKTLPRSFCTISTPWGEVHAKKTLLPDGSVKIAPEFEALKVLADEKGLSLREVFDQLRGSTM